MTRLLSEDVALNLFYFVAAMALAPAAIAFTILW
jgi:hypothetical protein